ncbi:MAG: hypothetical protein MAG794_00636 [Gammaproteobacteria bacterium]|nr:hypothetical protein [Gammaproteobacteria bacterium]
MVLGTYPSNVGGHAGVGWLSALFAVCLLTACATSPLDTSDVTSGATPTKVVELFPNHRGGRVQWGGHIISIANDARMTRIEVLSYPLARDGLPNTYRKPTGRFVLQHDDFLEPQDYAPGRILTVVGTVDSLITTSVGDTEFLVPLISAEQMNLWSDRYGSRSRSRFGFGVGISIGL